jgi:hypothetical protein
MYGERAANSAAEERLRIFEERFDEACDFPELTNITAAAIALFISSIVKPSASLNSGQAGLHESIGDVSEASVNPSSTSFHQYWTAWLKELAIIFPHSWGTSRQRAASKAHL